MKGDDLTQFITSYEKGVSKIAEVLANARERLDLYIDSRGFDVIVRNKLIKKTFLEVIESNIQIRWIIHMSKENVSIVKELIELITKTNHRGELRHLAGFNGCLLITKSYCIISPLITKSRAEITLTNAESFIRQQQFIFNILWNKSISADQRLNDIEKGKTSESTDTIVEPVKVLETIWKMCENAQKEILIIFSSANAWVRQERAGSFDLLMEISKNRNLSVRILTPRSQHIEALRAKLRSMPYNIDIQYIQEFTQIKLSVMLVDKKTAVVLETKDDETMDTLEAIRLTTYSTNSSFVLTYLSIFESFWQQSQIYEQSINELQQTKEYLNKVINELSERKKISDSS